MLDSQVQKRQDAEAGEESCKVSVMSLLFVGGRKQRRSECDFKLSRLACQVVPDSRTSSTRGLRVTGCCRERHPRRIEEGPSPLTEHSCGALVEIEIPKRSDSCRHLQLSKRVEDRDEVVCAWLNFVTEIGFSFDKLVSCRVRG